MTKVPAKFFEKSKILRLRGQNFPVPSPVEEFLESLYGEWRTPIKSANKKSYFSKQAFYKKEKGIIKKLKIKLNNLFLPIKLSEFPKIQRKILIILFPGIRNWVGVINQTGQR